MFGNRYFGARYFGDRFFGVAAGGGGEQPGAPLDPHVFAALLYTAGTLPKRPEWPTLESPLRATGKRKRKKKRTEPTPSPAVIAALQAYASEQALLAERARRRKKVMALLICE